MLAQAEKNLRPCGPIRTSRPPGAAPVAQTGPWPHDDFMQLNGRTNGHIRRDRWHGITRPYDASAVDRLRPSIAIEHTLARHGAERLWSLLESEPYVHSLGAMTGNQAVEQ